MGKSQREKGKRGEREAKEALNKLFGLAAIRAAQSNGKWSEDILNGLSGFYHEVKFYARHSVLRWMKQAEKDCGNDAPIIMLRENGDPEFYLLIRMKDSYRFMESVSRTPNADVASGKQGSVPVRE